MKNIGALTITIFLSASAIAQKGQFRISRHDSVLLKKFWTEFRTAINTNNKHKLEDLCEFPFYCSPCLDYVNAKPNEVTVKVTRQLFEQSIHKLFFSEQVRKKASTEFSLYDFYPSKFKHLKCYQFSYDIIPPSKKTEGIQGFIYLTKVKGMYKINGIDTVP